jgi:hypothetical protein
VLFTQTTTGTFVVLRRFPLAVATAGAHQPGKPE